MVPVPLDFHPALATVITMLPLALTIANILTSPPTPAANVAVDAVTVLK